MKQHYLFMRKWLQSANSKESLNNRLSFLSRVFRYKYEPIEEMFEKGVSDIAQRLDFLKRESVGRVLDVGCYDGFFSIELAKRGHSVVGVDSLKLCVDYAQKSVNGKKLEINFFKAYAEDLPFSSNSFNTTILSHTLEHVFDESLALKEGIRVTKPGGKLIVVLPTELGNAPAHLRYISKGNLSDLLKKDCRIISSQKVGDGEGYIGVVEK